VGGASWRWIFYVNVPVCVVALVLAWRGLPPDGPRDRGHRLDLLGLALLSPALASVIYGLSQVGARGGGVRPRVLVVAGLHRTRGGPRVPPAPRPP
jgi:MFS family permease